MASRSKPPERKQAPAARRKRSNRSDASKSDTPGEELIVISHAGAMVRADRDGVPTTTAADVGPLSKAFAPPDVNLIPLFGRPEDRLRRGADPPPSQAASDGAEMPDLSLFYRVDAPRDQLRRIADLIRQCEAFNGVYIKPSVEPPHFDPQPPAMGAPPAMTPDFRALQGYLGPAPGGVDARHAWTVPGGDGTGVEIIDIEGAWRFSHECLKHLGGIVGGGVPQSDLGWRNNGTAVLGIMGARARDFGVAGICSGVAGICPGATIGTISLAGSGQTTATAILQAADRLELGDIILIEAHRPGPDPTSPFRPNLRQIGYIPIEWWPDDYAAIAYAVRKGVIVVAAAGNGGVSLDDAIYDQNPGASDGYGPFPDWWENPFRRKKLDSGAILVGAGAPPSGRSLPDRSRLDFSNHGAAVDAQGWGGEVVTTGYGDLQGPRLFEDLWYTQSFGGTSSAAAIVVGALACLQGAIKTSRRRPLTSPEARDLLQKTGSPQMPCPGRDISERIGHRPDLKQMLLASGLVREPTGEAARESEGQGRGPAAAVEADRRGRAAGGQDRHPDAGPAPIDRLKRLEDLVERLERSVSGNP